MVINMDTAEKHIFAISRSFDDELPYTQWDKDALRKAIDELDEMDEDLTQRLALIEGHVSFSEETRVKGVKSFATSSRTWLVRMLTELEDYERGAFE